VIHGVWLSRVAHSVADHWALQAGAQVKVYYGSVLKTWQGQAVFVSSGELETGWGTANRLIYTLPAELISKLDELAADHDHSPSDDDMRFKEEEEEEEEEEGDQDGCSAGASTTSEGAPGAQQRNRQ